MREIKDFLHLYLGCVCECGVTGDSVKEKRVLDEINPGVMQMAEKGWIKPILRLLSDMTEEEKTEIAKQWTWYDGMQIVGEQHFNIRHQINHEMVEKALDFTNEDDGDRMSPLAYYQILPYLLKQGFDLFGLIEASLAIDKSKLSKG